MSVAILNFKNIQSFDFIKNKFKTPFLEYENLLIESGFDLSNEYIPGLHPEIIKITLNIFFY